jgi:hypothetical protein
LFICSFISQCLLAKIFWNLGTIDEDRADADTEREDSFSEIYTEDFDEDAEVQARIWNSFNRGILAENQEHFVTSTTSAISNSKSSALVYQPFRHRDKSIQNEN